MKINKLDVKEILLAKDEIESNLSQNTDFDVGDYSIEEWAKMVYDKLNVSKPKREMKSKDYLKGFKHGVAWALAMDKRW